MVSETKTAVILLASGVPAKLDAADLALVSGVRWYHHCGYARGTVEGVPTYMHRLITGAQRGQVCDHINGDKLDNRRANLRLTDTFGNARNKLGKAGYLGVFRQYNKWAARLVREGKTYYLGSYDSEADAAYAVDVARLKIDGELLRPNVPGHRPDAATKRAVSLSVRQALGARNAVRLSPSVISRIRSSPLSNKYWAQRLGVSRKVIQDVRSA